MFFSMQAYTHLKWTMFLFKSSPYYSAFFFQIYASQPSSKITKRAFTS